MHLSRYKIAALAALLPACSGRTPGPDGEPLVAPAATAELRNGAGDRIGVATFTRTDSGATLGVSVSELTPGEHGIHVHQNGDCSGPDFTSAGPHFNPTGRKHGLQNPEGPHAGDLPNLLVEPDGSADVTLPIAAEVVRPRAAALVIHAKADDQRTDPSGESGDRVACGVIRPQ
jgi:Cu-Zn family superoxide dismutase